jgi:hypothetical protein
MECSVTYKLVLPSILCGFETCDKLKVLEYLMMECIILIVEVN